MPMATKSVQTKWKGRKEKHIQWKKGGGEKDWNYKP